MQNYNSKPKVDIKQRSYLYALNVIRFLKQLDQKDFVLLTVSKQLIRSATSVGANIIEAQAASTRKDFTNFINHALKSINESLFWLNLLADLNLRNLVLIRETKELGAILGASVVTLREK